MDGRPSAGAHSPRKWSALPGWRTGDMSDQPAGEAQRAAAGGAGRTEADREGWGVGAHCRACADARQELHAARSYIAQQSQRVQRVAPARRAMTS